MASSQSSGSPGGWFGNAGLLVGMAWAADSPGGACRHGDRARDRQRDLYIDCHESLAAGAATQSPIDRAEPGHDLSDRSVVFYCDHSQLDAALDTLDRSGSRELARMASQCGRDQ